MIVKYYAKHVYGNVLYYCLDIHMAEVLQRLTGCKTIKTEHMECLELLDVKFELVHEPRGDRK